MKHILTLAFFVAAGYFSAHAQAKPEDTEKWDPVPPKIAPGKTPGAPPSDAIILFNGSSLNEWVNTSDGSPASWLIDNGKLTVNKSTGNIQTKKYFTNYQLHIEWAVPSNITGSGQARGNSGIFLASTGKGDDGYELQVLDSYDNKTYVNGMAGSIYKQGIPLVNPTTPVGEWQYYDIIWTAPTFNSDGSVKSTAHVTVLLNGVLVQNNFELAGKTMYIGKPSYQQHGPSPIKLQAHGDKSEPLSYRNIWVREL